MCWSGEASATRATIGLTSTAYVAWKGEKKALWIPLGYFSLMELLQAFTYTVIDQPDLPLNQLLTLFGVLHIIFQPFFLSTVALHFIPERSRQKIAPFVYGMCFVSTILMLVKLYPFAWAGTCTIGYEPLCGSQLCSVSGNWHIAWNVPMNGLKWLTLGYYIPVFVAPLIYGSWKFTVYHLIVGPLAARISTDNINEWPAVWCLLSIGMFLIAIKTPLRQILYVKQWWLWDTEAEASDLEFEESEKITTPTIPLAVKSTADKN